MAPENPRDELEYLYSLPAVQPANAPGEPAPLSNTKIRRVAFALFIVAGVLFFAYVLDLISTGHDSAAPRLFGSIFAAVGLFLVREFPKTD
jgi:hypothetical protein